MIRITVEQPGGVWKARAAGTLAMLTNLPDLSSMIMSSTFAAGLDGVGAGITAKRSTPLPLGRIQAELAVKSRSSSRRCPRLRRYIW
jgi:hypothetical protein